MNTRPAVIAHRGASRAAPENTVAAFHRARELGADWVELDVRVSSDGALVVHHDARYADGRSVHEVGAGDRPAAVALLASALDACVGMGVNVEIKNSPGDEGYDEAALVVELTVAALHARPDDQAILVSCFDAPTLAQVRALDAAVATAQLTFALADPAETIAAVVAAGHRALHPFDLTVDAALVAAAHEAGLAVNVWTVDDPTRITELAALGVDGICTNVPDVAVAVLRSP